MSELRASVFVTTWFSLLTLKICLASEPWRPHKSHPSVGQAESKLASHEHGSQGEGAHTTTSDRVAVVSREELQWVEAASGLRRRRS